MSPTHHSQRVATSLQRAFAAAAVVLLGACVGAAEDSADETWGRDDRAGSVESEVPMPGGDGGGLPSDDEAEPPAAGDDEAVGGVVEEPDPEPGDDPCLEHDDCPTPPDSGTGDDGGDEPQDEVDPPPPADYVAGDVLLTLTYAPLRKQPDNQAGTADVHLNGGAHGGHPKGTVPPGQEVTVRATSPTNHFVPVAYRGHEGWIHRNKLILLETSVHPVTFARRSSVRNAFFMHQLRRARWNKDGPGSSANCAPTSLAMAAKIFGHGEPGKTIEQSIHEARRQYDPAPLCESCATSRADIRTAAQKLGLNVHTLEAVGNVESRMDRIDQALGNKRLVVLEGYAGQAYRDRMTEAYRNADNAWVRDRIYTYGDEPGEYHSILVVSRLDSGKYLVADPLSEVGMVTMSRAALKSFFSRWGGTGNVVW